MKKITNDAYNTIFAELGRDWALITAQKDGKVNTMTAAWGGIGVMWGKDVAFVVVRPTRYTKEFLDAGDTFSLSFLPAEHKKTLSYFGSVSGREEDKIAKSGLAIAREDDIPYFEAAEKAVRTGYVPGSLCGHLAGCAVVSRARLSHALHCRNYRRA